ncbi:sarcosine oxidase subunit gamma family protein [Ruegeria sp. HKCCD7255]|uniref:sarcosine oxidase subunit gamma n=1 Tax=Ruegeria sp. HKCCD7255 TaxID=2683004 RepID=UPI001489C5AF
MDKLSANTPCDGLLPLTVGSVTLSEVDAGSIHSISAFKGKQKQVSDTLKAAHGMAYPAANRATGKAGARAIWFGPAHAMLMGPAPDDALAENAAVVDQSDAWAVVRIEGAGVEDVLARVTPVDLRSTRFKRGHTARTLLFHMTASITRIGDTAFQIMVFRSMAETLVHDLKRAMEGAAARG